MKKVNSRRLVFLLSSALILFTVIITVISALMSYSEVGTERNYEDYSTGWVDDDGNEVDLDKLTQSCRIHKIIPELESDSTLSFNARNVDVDVYVDDVCIYKCEKTDDPLLKTIYGKTNGSDVVEVQILKPFRGRTLYLDITNPYTNTSSCKIVHIYLGDGVEIVKHNASIQLGAFCFSTLILFLGIICLILYIPMYRRKMVDRSMLYLGTMAFAFGMSMITDCKLLHIIVGHETLYYTVSQMFMILIAVPMLLFFSKMYGNLNEKVVMILSAANILDFMVLFILTCLGVCDYHDGAAPTLLVLIVSILYMTVVTIRAMCSNVKKNLFHNIGVLMIGISVVLDLIMMRSDYFVETSFFTRLGLAGFMCLECTQVLWRHLERFQSAMKAQLISRLAYHDGLTDMLNRTSFMEDMDALENEEHDTVLIAMFDVNDLKYVNDNFGHSDGDRLLITAANAIRDSFGHFGKCYRIGGDEFVFITTADDAEKSFIDARQKMTAEVEMLTMTSKYPISIASGYAIRDDSHRNVRDVMDEADEKMYANKKIMKSTIIHEKKPNPGIDPAAS